MAVRSDSVTLDIRKVGASAGDLHFTAHDKGATILVTVADGGTPLDLAGLTAELRADTPGGYVRSTLPVSGSAAVYTLSDDLTSREGEARCYVALLQGDSVIASTQHFVVHVGRCADMEGEQAEAVQREFDRMVYEWEAQTEAQEREFDASQREREEAFDDAEEARKEAFEAAEGKRAEAESKRATAEGQRAEAERKRAEAEKSRVAEEGKRATAETARADAESKRAAGEEKRAAGEEQRATAESKRAAGEDARKSAETGRERAEKSRVAAETGRADAEKSRAEAESKRESAEKSRAAEEGKRATAEASRADAEGKRATAEQARSEAEAARASDEGVRKSAEGVRAAEEAKRASAEGVRAAAESARESAEEARSSAEAARATAEKARAAADAERETRQAKNDADQAANNEAARNNQPVWLGEGQYDPDTLVPAVGSPVEGRMYLVPLGQEAAMAALAAIDGGASMKGRLALSAAALFDGSLPALRAAAQGESGANAYVEWLWHASEGRWEQLGVSQKQVTYVTTGEIDRVAAGEAPSGESVLGLTGLSYLWAKVKAAFAPKSHKHAASDVSSGTLSSDRLPTVPLSKGGTGAATKAAAVTNLLGSLPNVTAAISDGNAVAKYVSASGIPGYYTALQIWQYVKGKVDALYAAKSHTHTPSSIGAAASSHTHAAAQVTGLAASRALVSDASGHPAASAVTSAELGCLDGVTANVQEQINAKAASSHSHPAATQGAAGMMSASDKKKLDGVAAGATAYGDKAAFLAAHPVGSYLITSDPADPSARYGGKWEARELAGVVAWKRVS